MAEQLQDRPTKALTFVVGSCEVYLPLAGLVEVSREIQRLAAVLEATKMEIERSQQLLANSGFVSKAPSDVVQRERDKLAELLLRQAKIEERLATLRQ